MSDIRRTKVLDLLKGYALKLAGERTIADVRIGLVYTAVTLSDNSTGVAMTFHHDMDQRCSSLEPAIAGSLVTDVIEKANSPKLVERTVAIAAINAVLNQNQENLVRADTIEILKPTKEDVVGMVGNFGPLVKKLKGNVKELYIFEKSISKSADVLPAEKAFELLPLCSIAIITSTSLINETFEKISKAAGNCRKVAMVGGTTPLAPEVFAGYGINLLSGIIIKDTHEILRIVSESGGMKSFKAHIDKVNLFC